MAKIKPLGNRVLVQRVQAQTSKGGILLPDSAQDKKTTEGVVVSVGPGKLNDQGHLEPMCVKEKDRVIFGPYSGTEVKENDQEYLILSEDDLYLVLS